MKSSKVLIAGLALAVAGSAFAVKKSSGSFSARQKTEIQQIVREYLVSNPEVLVEVSKSLQRKQQQQMLQKANAAIDANADALFDKNSPMAGKADADVTVVEFFDYQCVHCRNMAPVIDALISSNKNLRVVFKEFPIFGKGSAFASEAALAAKMQGKYLAFHQALISKKQRLSPAIVLQVADSVGLNTAKLKADMKSDAVQNELKGNQELAKKLGLMGTPAFVIASTPKGKFVPGGKAFFVPGAASEEALKGFIAQAAEAK